MGPGVHIYLSTIHISADKQVYNFITYSFCMQGGDVKGKKVSPYLEITGLNGAKVFRKQDSQVKFQDIKGHICKDG